METRAPCPFLFFLCAFGAYSFHDVVHFVGGETFRNPDGRDRVFVQAICFPAFLAVKMAVRFLCAAMSPIVAQAEFVEPASVIHAVDEAAFVEERKSAKDDGFVDARQFVFERGEAERVAYSADCIVNEQAGRCRAYACIFKYGYIAFGFHDARNKRDACL